MQHKEETNYNHNHYTEVMIAASQKVRHKRANHTVLNESHEITLVRTGFDRHVQFRNDHLQRVG